MTYIAAFHQPGVNAIISDMRTTWQVPGGTKFGKNTGVKTGQLCQGIIFGRVGDVEESGKFVRGFKEQISDVTDTLPGFWRRFEDYAATFPRASERPFTVLVSERSSGQPKFHVFKTEFGLATEDVPHQCYVLTYGSGKEYLDDFVSNSFQLRMKEVTDRLIAEFAKQPDIVKNPVSLACHVSPYFLCLWFSELSLTGEAGLLEQHDVGGPFHFVGQSATGEYAQGPAVYFFLSVDRRSREVRLWTWRVANVLGGIYIERSIPPGWLTSDSPGDMTLEFNYDGHLHPEHARKSPVDLENDVRDAVSASPFFQFWGVGYTNHSDRNNFGFAWSPNGKRDSLFDGSGHLQPDFQAHIAQALDKCFLEGA